MVWVKTLLPGNMDLMIKINFIEFVPNWKSDFEIHTLACWSSGNAEVKMSKLWNTAAIIKSWCWWSRIGYMVIIQRITVMVFSLHPYVFNSLRGRHAWNSFHFLRCRRSAYCCKFSHNDHQSQNNHHSYHRRSWCTFQVGITAGVTFALTVFAFQTKIDFTACGGRRHYYITIYHIVL